MAVLVVRCRRPPRLGSGLRGWRSFGIDHRLHYDNSGLWKRSNQNVLIYGTILGVTGGALAFGDNDTFGDTLWRSVDAMVVTGIGSEAMKYTFQRERPSQTSEPDRFFAGRHAQSFPSGEVAAISAAVTPFIVTYGEGHPAVYALALLPAYDAVARMKTHGHWRSDVLAGAALGAGKSASGRSRPGKFPTMRSAVSAADWPRVRNEPLPAP